MISRKRIKSAAAGSIDLARILVKVLGLWSIGLSLLLIAFWGVLAGAFALLWWAGTGMDALCPALGVAAVAAVTMLAAACGWCGIRVFERADKIIRAQATPDTIDHILNAKDSLLRGVMRPSKSNRDELLRPAGEKEIVQKQLLRGHSQLVRHNHHHQEIDK